MADYEYPLLIASYFKLRRDVTQIHDSIFTLERGFGCAGWGKMMQVHCPTQFPTRPEQSIIIALLIAQTSMTNALDFSIS